jgi:ubiquinone/menaquinone biosynthesis C-methylase UbiE/predicted RNA binding protein with dsRBD fold (UPF0201 family)
MAQRDDKNKQNQELTERMRSEWDRRIRHDYRYWMSDGVESDDEMFRVGKRDLDILLEGLNPDDLKSWTALDVGCGVGRLLRPASEVFGQVIGLDVSEAGLEEAGRLLAKSSNVKLVLGNGVDFDQIDSNSIDFVYSFAALSSMPVRVIVAYLLEVQRVLRDGGTARLQLYLGAAQGTVEQDSIAIRSFDKGRFAAAVQAAGFQIESIKDLVLPFEISDEAAGLSAKIASLKKSGPPALTEEQIQEILLPGGETTAKVDWAGSETEYLMAIARATQLIEAGEQDAAREALQFAVTHYGAPDADVETMLAELQQASDSTPPEVSTGAKSDASAQTTVDDSFLIRNAEILKSRFPMVSAAIEEGQADVSSSTQQASSGEPVVTISGTPLDQLIKPGRSGEVWAERALNTSKVRESEDIIVVGFASGYHVRSLLKKTDKRVHVIEPQRAVLKEALSARDCSFELEHLTTLSTSINEFINTVRPQEKPLGSISLVLHPQTQAREKRFIDELRTAIWSGRKFEELRPSIAVVGPIYGGSLPIAGYVYEALKSLGHRVQYYSLEDFYKPYTKIIFIKNTH